MTKIQSVHLSRVAVIYLRQSSLAQVRNNLESQRLQYALQDRAKALGWSQVEVIDTDLGMSAAGGGRQRPGFERLISMVALGLVGIILSREISRLSRNDRDFCRLLEVCRVFGTLIGDDDPLYDPAELDDQLILGIKGTLSVVELGVLRLRMQQGKEASAARGKLRHRLPSGYVYDPDGHPVKSPDQRTREAVELFFERFAELQNGRQLFMWLNDEKHEMPVRQLVHGKLRSVWRTPTLLYVQTTLHNPFYAGAYTYGRRPREAVVRDGQVIKRTGKLRRPEECRVFIRDHHEAYIRWEQYEKNVQILARNCSRKKMGDAMTSAREGSGLLVGMLRCGHCGRRLHVNYWGRSGTSPRYVCRGAQPDTNDGCLSFAGTLVDKELDKQLLSALSPLAIDASVEAKRSVGKASSQKISAHERRAQQLRYEAERAFEQYDEADPKNRLVAAELERRWNVKLEAAQQAEAELARAQQEREALDEPALARLTQLGEDFEQVWTSASCSNAQKKKIVRTALEEVVVTRSRDALVFVVHWAGGVHTEMRFDRPAPGSQVRTKDDALEIIRKLAPRYDDSCIAAVLNKNGMRTGRGNKWNRARVYSARVRFEIRPQHAQPHTLGLLSQKKAAAHADVSLHILHKLLASGLVTNEQTVPHAPYEVRVADLDSPKVQDAIHRFKVTGRLSLGGTAKNQQQRLL